MKINNTPLNLDPLLRQFLDTHKDYSLNIVHVGNDWVVSVITKRNIKRFSSQNIQDLLDLISGHFLNRFRRFFYLHVPNHA